MFKAFGFGGSRSEKGSFPWFMTMCMDRARDIDLLHEVMLKRELIKTTRGALTAAMSNVSVHSVGIHEQAPARLRLEARVGRRSSRAKGATSTIISLNNTLDVDIKNCIKDYRASGIGRGDHQRLSM